MHVSFQVDPVFRYKYSTYYEEEKPNSCLISVTCIRMQVFHFTPKCSFQCYMLSGDTVSFCILVNYLCSLQLLNT